MEKNMLLIYQTENCTINILIYDLTVSIEMQLKVKKNVPIKTSRICLPVKQFTV